MRRRPRRHAGASRRDLRNLTLAGPRLNRYRKVAKDAAEWLPEKNRCWFAHRIIKVRRAYSLTIDQREAQALDAVLASCESSDMVMFPRKTGCIRIGIRCRGPVRPLQELHGIAQGPPPGRAGKAIAPIRAGWIGTRTAGPANKMASP